MWQRVNVAWADLITGAIGGVLEHNPHGLDPVPPLGAVIAAFLALYAKLKLKLRWAILDPDAALPWHANMRYVPSWGASTWGHKRLRTCLGRGAQQQLSMDQQQLQGAQHQLAVDQQQLQDSQHQLAVDQQQLQDSLHQLAVYQQQLQGAQHQLGASTSWGPDPGRHAALQGCLAQGCLALFKPSTILVGCSQVHLQVAGAQGRVLRVDAELAGRPASLVCVYAPAQASERATFFSSCLPACLPLASDRRLVIMGGDFNCILSPEDKVGTPRVGNTAHPVGWLGSRGQGAQQLQELVTERGLVDAWRHLRPGTRDFTHFSTPWQTGGRLDRWYIPAELVEWQLDSSILGLKPVHTDHAAVSLAVCPPNLPLTAPAPWQLHPAYLDDPDMMDRLQSFLLREAASHAAQMSSLPSPLPRDLHRARWAHIKQGLALQAQRCIRDRRRAQRALQQARERAAHAARTHLVQQLLEVEQLREAALQAAVVVGEATALVGVTDRAEAAQRSMQASAVLDQVYGDSSSFYFYHRHQSAHTPTLITSLHLPDLPDQVADLTTTHGVQAACHAFQSHFSAASPLGVYAAKPVVPVARATLLASLTSRLTPTQADSSEGPGGDPMLSEEELGRALQGCAHSKAPGKDGLPMEVYDRLWPLLRPPLMAMLREALADTSSPAPLAEFLTGLVTLVPKAGKPRDQVSGYRPITLLNCDVRLVARALEDRLQRPLDLLVSPSQSAFILGRDIGDNVQFHLSLLEYLRQRGSPAWLLLLDLAGAYDNVSWDLLQATMEAMGFRQDGHVRWAQILHRGATSQVLVNGHLTNSFPLESGLLQGSGASPLYWCIVLQPLVSYLSSLQLAGRLNTPSIPISPLASHMATLQPTLPSKEYADDITITVLDRVKDGAVVVEALEVFRAAGGPALSMGKSQALPCAQQELQQGQHGWAGGGAGAHELGPGEAEGRLELGAGGGEPRGGEEHGRRERQQQARGPKPLSESGGPSTGIPATREGVPVRHLGVPLGAVCDGVSSEAAFGGSAAAMTAASLSWTPQGLNLLGRVQVAQQCLASKPIYQMAFIKPSAAHGKAMAKAVKRFVAMSDLPQERSPNMSRLGPGTSWGPAPVGGQTLDDMQAKAVLASIVPPELREHRLLIAFSRLTGCDRDWVRDAAARNAAPAPLHSSGRAVHFASVKRRDRRGNQGISQSDFDAVRTFLLNHSKPSPSRKDLRTWRSVIMTAAQFHGKEEPTNTVTDTKRFTDCSVPDLHRMYMQEQASAGQPSVSLHTFMALMPPWIARLSAAQRQVCVCKTCCNIKLVLTVLAQHKVGLALELPGPAPGTAAPLPAAPGAGTAAPPPGALGAAGEDGDGDTAHLLAADSPFVDPNGEFEHPHPHHHLPVPPPVLAASPTQLSATSVRGLYMCSCGPDAPHQARCCHRTCSDCKDKCMNLKPGVDGSIMLSVKQYAPVKQKEGPARIELQQFRLSLREVVDKLNEQMPSYIWHHFVAHHQLAVFRRQQQAVQEKAVERPTEIQSDHWHHHNVGIFVACAYFRNDRDEYREETVYVLTDGKDQSAAVTQAALHQVLDYLQGERCMVMKQLCMWSDGCAAQFKGTPALQLHRRMAMRYQVSVWWSYGATSHFKGRHDSEGGVFKHSMAARVLADHPVLSAECKAQQLAGVHNVECVVPAAQLAASVAHQTRGSVQRRWCLVLKDEEVEQCAEPDPDAHRLLRTISGSRAMHAMFFPADGVAPMWSETACACVRHMGSKPQQCMCHGASTLSSIPMFGRVTLASDKEEDVQCLKLLHARAPHIASSYMTLTVHLLKEYARECLGWKGKRLTQNKPLLRADILEHLRWEQEMEEDQLAEVGVDEADD
ncbi:hypothetical protein QJQ45_021783, partial [Haematococcus lacustris]